MQQPAPGQPKHLNRSPGQDRTRRNREFTLPQNDRDQSTIQLEISVMFIGNQKRTRPTGRTGIKTMAARIIQLAEARARRSETSAPAARPLAPANLAERFHFWTGASGRRYVHTVYSLIECPSLAAGSVLLVRRDETGRRQLLEIATVSHEAESLNLAEIRQKGALLGANEVHVHLLAGSSRMATLVAFDLKSAEIDGASGSLRSTRH